MSLYLEPVGLASEHLKSDIEIDTSSNNSIILGRNPLTVKTSSHDTKFIEFVSRKQAELVIMNNSIYIKPLTQTVGTVTVNGEPCPYNNLYPLSIGDTFCLLGSHGYFNFKLKSQSKKRKMDSSQDTTQISPTPASHRSNIAATDNPTQFSSQAVPYPNNRSPHESTRSKTDSQHSDKVEFIGSSSSSNQNKIRSLGGLKSSNENTTSALPIASSDGKVEEQLECAICFNHMAFAHSISPCGDSFCFECINAWSSRRSTCPNCISEFQTGTMIPNRPVDNVIQVVLERNSGSTAGLKALEDWKQRCEQGKALKKILNEGKAGSSSSSSAINVSNPDPVAAFTTSSSTNIGRRAGSGDIRHAYGNAHRAPVVNTATANISEYLNATYINTHTAAAPAVALTFTPSTVTNLIEPPLRVFVPPSVPQSEVMRPSARRGETSRSSSNDVIDLT